MGTCPIDHSLEDVVKKLDDQKPFLPKELADRTEQFLREELSQNTLNELFHLLKKYDLASEEERAGRNVKMTEMLAKKA